MRKPTYPTLINLKELEGEGEALQFSRVTGELNSVLEDLIQKHPYDVEVSLRPMGNAYGITGKIATKMSLTCARCGRDMVEDIHDKFDELIVVMKEKPRAGHSGHTGSHEHGPFCNYTTSYQFSLADFIHEHIASAEPYTPQCKRSDCESYFMAAQATASTAMPETDTNPFAVLKNIDPKGRRE